MMIMFTALPRWRANPEDGSGGSLERSGRWEKELVDTRQRATSTGIPQVNGHQKGGICMTGEDVGDSLMGRGSWLRTLLGSSSAMNASIASVWRDRSALRCCSGGKTPPVSRWYTDDQNLDSWAFLRQSGSQVFSRRLTVQYCLHISEKKQDTENIEQSLCRRENKAICRELVAMRMPTFYTRCSLPTAELDTMWNQETRVSLSGLTKHRRVSSECRAEFDVCCYWCEE